MYLPVVLFLQRGKTFRGFTLIELLISFALIVTVSTLVTAAYYNYDNSQKVDTAAAEIALLLEKAKSRAQSQVKPDTIVNCTAASLDGYEMNVCGLTSSSCNTARTYQLRIRCGGTYTTIETKELPSGVNFDASSQPTYFFQVLNGTATTGTITVTNGSKTKTVRVTGIGVISVQ